MKYNKLAKLWLEEHRNFIKGTTYSNYRFIVYRHLLPEIGNIELEDIDHNIIQDIAIKKANGGKLNSQGGLTNKNVKNIMLVLRLSLKYAIKHKLITNEVDLKIKYPYNDEKSNKIKIFSSEEMIRLVQYLKTDLSCKNIGLLIVIHSGLRIGEICALKWKHINLEEGYVEIEKNIQRLYYIDSDRKSEVVEISPKSEKSERIIPLPNWLIKILKIVKSNPNNYILTSTDNYVEPRVLRYYFKSVLVKNKVRILPFHSLRHTFATTCIRNKIDYKTTSELLGHSSVATTLDLYLHSDLDTKRKSINKLKF